jgi:hypothetical protein
MRKEISPQDHGVAVLFSAFVTILVNEESPISSRVVQTLDLTDLLLQTRKTS